MAAGHPCRLGVVEVALRDRDALDRLPVLQPDRPRCVWGGSRPVDDDPGLVDEDGSVGTELDVDVQPLPVHVLGRGGPEDDRARDHTVGPATFSGSSERALRAADRARSHSKPIGRTEITMIPKMTREKFFFTIGALPNQ